MKIIIPMSGQGNRFIGAGYQKPKPLIEVEGKPIIAHVIDMFPNEYDFIFICNSRHLETTNMNKVLKEYCPTGKILNIEEHKYGPVFAVSKAYDLIQDNEEVIINYCDFTCYWNYFDFKNWTNRNSLDGCIPAYKGFHPHSIRGNNYAFMRVKDGVMQEIKEKEPFTDNKINEFASTGTYYFSRGSYVKHFFAKLMAEDININNEYYCSLIYNLMVKEELKIGVYEIDYFMQWGTPEDLDEYNYWSNIFRSLAKTKQELEPREGFTLIPMAGKGKRFRDEGYQNPKPLLDVSGFPMFIQAANSLPPTENYVFAVLSQHLGTLGISQEINNNFKNYQIIEIEDVQPGQACTCLKSIEGLDPLAPITITACDHAAIFDIYKLNKILDDETIDVIIWTCTGHPEATIRPEMYGWVISDDKKVLGVSVKSQLNDPTTDNQIIGTFSFRKIEIFKKCVQRMINRKAMVNGEYYVDSCIEDALELGYNCKIFQVDNFICWGTPNEYKSFKYWQKAFNKWNGHPYEYNLDNWTPEKFRVDNSQKG